MTITLRERKQELIETSEDYKHEVEAQLKDIQRNTLKWAGTALVVGGSLYAGYLIIKKISGRKKNKLTASVPNERALAVTSPQESTVVRMIKEQIALFLVAIIKQKLVTLLEDYKQRDESKNL